MADAAATAAERVVAIRLRQSASSRSKYTARRTCDGFRASCDTVSEKGAKSAWLSFLGAVTAPGTNSVGRRLNTDAGSASKRTGWAGTPPQRDSGSMLGAVKRDCI